MSVTAAPAPAASRRGFHPLAVSRVDRLCDDAAAVTFEVPPGLADVFAFRPGQSLTVRRSVGGRDERRSYSICSPAGSAPRIGVRAVDGGVVSRWLAHQLQPGDTVEVAPPAGTFTPDLDRPGRHVLVAAGSGITPLLSIAASLLDRPGHDVALLYGNRSTRSVMFADEIADLKDAHPTRFQVAHVLSREPQDVELFSGRIDADRLRRLLPLVGPVDAVDGWWLCGPHAMVTDAAAVLADLGVPAGRVHRELFWVEDTPPEPARHPDPAAPIHGSQVTVILDGRATTATVARDTPVLDAALRTRADLPFACKGGVCGTCRARVVRGEVHMRRNFALEPAEVEAGFVLTCQSLPASDELVVDYDA